MTPTQLSKIMPRAGTPYIAALISAMDEFGINTPARQQMFAATVAHESAQLTVLVENLNYSAEALRRVFGKYFPTDTMAANYARQPARIANRVYASRGGNGPEASGDGWRYRGAGAIQLTFHDNQAACADYFKRPLATFGDWLRTPEGACRSAGWFWSTNKINRFADANDFDGVSDAVNRGKKTAAVGDSNGWSDRLAYFNLARKVAA
jgi:putative chitinase